MHKKYKKCKDIYCRGRQNERKYKNKRIIFIFLRMRHEKFAKQILLKLGVRLENIDIFY